VRLRRFAVEVKTSCAAIEEATDPPDHPGREPLELEGVKKAGVAHCIKGALDIKLQ
jgi:hypothetical protein